MDDLSRSLDDNNLTDYGKDMSAVLKLAEVLPQTKIQTLRCLPAECRRSLLAPAVCACFRLLPAASFPMRPLLMTVAFESDE